mgnify:CR=1 FL=1
MQLTDEQVEEFQELYFKEFWVKISPQEAREWWTKLISLMKTILDIDIR